MENFKRYNKYTLIQLADILKKQTKVKNIYC